MNRFCGRANSQTHAPPLKLQFTPLINHSDRQLVDRHGFSLLGYQKGRDKHDSLKHICVTVLMLNLMSKSKATTLEAVELIRKKTASHKHTHTHTQHLFISFMLFSPRCTSQRLLKQPIMLPQQEVATDLPAALFLFGFVNSFSGASPSNME